MSKLYNYRPKGIHQSSNDPFGFKEEPNNSTFLVKQNFDDCDDPDDDGIYIKFVSGNKEAWDKMGHINKSYATSDELTKPSAIELILHRTSEEHNDGI